MHCRGAICLERAPDCVCLCVPCGRAKTLEGWPVCPVCRRFYDGIRAGGYCHPDGSLCIVDD